MPLLPGRPCSHQGCTKLVRGRRVRFCDEHLAEERRRQDERRGTAGQRGYDAAWQAIQDRYLAEHPFCEVTPGCGRRAVLVHHVVSVRDGGTNDPGNLQAACRTCHARRHPIGASNG